MSTMTITVLNERHDRTERHLFITGLTLEGAQDAAREANADEAIVADLVTEAGADRAYGHGMSRFVITEDTNDRPGLYAVWLQVVGAGTGPGYPAADDLWED